MCVCVGVGEYWCVLTRVCLCVCVSLSVCVCVLKVFISGYFYQPLSLREYFPTAVALNSIVVVFCADVLVLQQGSTLKAKKPIIRLCTQRSIPAE